MKKSPFAREYEAVRKLLKEYRLKSGLTQQELAIRIGDTQSSISKWERGEKRLDIVQLRDFCKAVGIKMLDFVTQLEVRISSSGRVR